MLIKAFDQIMFARQNNKKRVHYSSIKYRNDIEKKKDP